MVKRLFRDSAIYAIPAAVSSAASFLLFPFYAHTFAPWEFGALDLLTLTAMLAWWTVALEIYQAVARFVIGEVDRSKVVAYASTAFWFTLAAYSVFGLLAELIAVQISRVLLGPHIPIVLFEVSVLWILAQGLLMLVQAQLRWQFRPRAYVACSLINTLVTVGASAALVFAAHLGVEGALLGQAIGSTAALAYALPAARNALRLTFDTDKLREMLTYSAPLIPSSIGVFLNMYADRLVIQHARSLADVGVYGVGYRLATIVSLVLTGFQGAAIPLILARKDEESAPRELADAFRIFAAVAASFFIVLSVMSPPALRLLTGGRYQRSAEVVPFLVVSILFGSMYIFAPGLMIAKRTKHSAVIAAASGLANLALALALVPPFGIVGAGVATATSSVVWFVALMRASQRHYEVPHEWTGLLAGAAVAVAIVGVSFALLSISARDALGAPSLVCRCALTAAGILVSARITLGAERSRRLAVRISSLTRSAHA